MVPRLNFFTGCLASDRFPFAQSIANENRVGKLLQFSCQSRCGVKTYANSSDEGIWKTCMCDRICLFLGDCCYDYLMKCGAQKLNIDKALAEQANFRRFADYATCDNHQMSSESPCGIRIVNRCPEDNLHTIHSVLCEAKNGTTSMFMPVVARGVPFRNVYCAACHGMLKRDVRIISKDHQLLCGDDGWEDTPWNMFNPRLSCAQNTLKVSKSYALMKFRLSENCNHDVLPSAEHCNDDEYQEECRAYSAYRAVRRENRILKNEACLACKMKGISSNITRSPRICPTTKHNRLSIINLFQFIESPPRPIPGDCPELNATGTPGNLCLMTKCQPGFNLYDNQCIPQNCSKSFLQPHENIYSTRYKIADLFRPALLVMFKKWGRRSHSLGGINDNTISILKDGQPCSLIQAHTYQHLLKVPNSRVLHCLIIYSDPFSFVNIVKMMETRELEDEIFFGFNVIKMVAFNHDPKYGLNCTRNTIFQQMIHQSESSEYRMKFISIKTGRPLCSDRDPIVVIKDTIKHEVTYQALFCKPNIGDARCCLKGYSAYDICPKYELEGIPDTWRGAMTLGGYMTADEYIYSKNGNVFVCTDVYDEMYMQFGFLGLKNAVLICYIVSLLSLLTTIVIYARNPSLRTKPGLMLLNLVLALFLAQLLFIMNSYALFKSSPIVCQIMATAQHYFWLASFAWMVCISLDLFQCLSNIATSALSHVGLKYHVYVIAAWVIPSLIPLSATVLTVTEAMDVYDVKTCWLSAPKNVFYFFALPVLCVVTTNVCLFAGSVCRLRAMWENATFAGRREDNKQRLIQCVKVSSWMGISWFFGIIPNFVHVQALWYIFAASNAFQGVHIFFAFGLTGRARILKKGNNHADTVQVSSTNVTPVVAQSEIWLI